MKEIINDARTRMQKALEALEHNLSVLRTGRANPGILHKITVEYYGSEMPINQLANITAPDARTLVVTPFDRSGLNSIEKAIRDSDLGLNPANKGDALYITIPALTEERRKELAKLAGQYAEKAKIAVRNVRRDANDALKHDEQKKEISEDDRKRLEIEVQKMTDDTIKAIDEAAAHKEKEIMSQ